MYLFLVGFLWFLPLFPVDAEEPIRVGVGLSLTGIYSEPADMMRRGYQLWVHETNKNGGLLGREVELILMDTRSDPEVTKRVYTRLIEDEGVDLIFSPYGTPLTMVASEVSEKAEMVMMAASAAGRQLWTRGYRYLFGIYVTADRFFIGFLDLLAREGIDRISVIHEDNAFNRDAARGVEEWAGKLGVRIDRSVEFTPGESDMDEVLDEAEITDRRGLIICSYPESGYESLRKLRARPIQPAALAMTITPVHPLFALRLKELADGVFAPSQWEPMERIPYPGTREFIEAFRLFSHMPPSYHASSAYAAGQVLALAVEATGGLDHMKLRNYISMLDTVTIIGRFKVDAAGRQVGHNPILIQWQRGKKEIVYPGKMRTAEAVFFMN